MSNVEETIIMPRSLTAENGAKYLLIGEFSESIRIACEYCDNGISYDDNLKQCEECDGLGSYNLTVSVGWTTIKEIYAKCVEHFDNNQQPKQTICK